MPLSVPNPTGGSGGWKDRKYLPEGTPEAYGGYYTKDDIRAIVAYAASKHINVLPEIEFPGHSEDTSVCLSGVKLFRSAL